jgi:hypothetical protein
MPHDIIDNRTRELAPEINNFIEATHKPLENPPGAFLMSPIHSSSHSASTSFLIVSRVAR